MRQLFVASIALFLLLFFACESVVQAADPTPLPTVLKGTTSVTDISPGGKTTYGGFTGNEAVYNPVGSFEEGEGQTIRKNLSPSLNFDLGQWVNIPTNSAIRPESITYSIWVKPSAWSIVGSDGINRASHFSFASGMFGLAGSNAVWFDFTKSDNVPYPNPVVPPDPSNPYPVRHYCWGAVGNLDKWNFYTITYDKTTGVAKNYLNGTWNRTCQFKAGIALGDRDLPLSTSVLRFGADSLGNWGSQASIDEATMYNRALTQTEVTALYNLESTNIDGLVGRWDFGEGSGSVVGDRTVNGSNGTLMSKIGVNLPAWVEDGPSLPIIDGYKYNGYDLFGFSSVNLGHCLNGIILNQNSTNCYVSNTTSGNMRVMTSRTYIEGKDNPLFETAALVQKNAALVVGDVYLGGMDLNDFAYWGRNLAQGTGSSADTFWGLNYTSAQSSFSTDKFKQYAAKITELQGEATTATNLSTGPWYLQTSDPADIHNPGIANSSYPQGRVWKTQASTPVVINSPIRFSGKGTIIIQGDLTITANYNVKPLDPNDSNSTLGIIVLGNVNFAGNTAVNAAIFAAGSDLTGGDMVFGGDNVTLVGSFVARNFTNITTRSNISLFYDKNLGSNWPPGFGSLNMPHPTEN